MAATFRTRPMLLASAARPSFTSSTLAARGLVANLEQTRQYAAGRRKIDPRFRNAIQHTAKNQGQQKATTSLYAEFSDDQKHHIDPADMALLAPGTVVPLPLSRAPSTLTGFLKYYYKVLRYRLNDRLSIFMQTNSFKKRFWHRAEFGAPREGIVDLALDLHAAMSHNLAAGGAAAKKALAQICIPKLQRSLVAAIEARPKGKSYRWERLSLVGKPRLIDHKWADLDTGLGEPLSYRQAVVQIRSRQRLTELDARGRQVSSKEMKLTENIVLWRRVNKERRTQDSWLLFGTLKETSPEELESEAELLKTMVDQRSETKLREREKKLEESKVAEKA